MNIIVIGAGAAGVFAAIAAKKTNPEAKVTILEKNNALLSKVRVSGGGRCNVTHSCFDPRLLVKNYPRGHRELLGPFYRFQPQDTVEWFESRGVPLKTEADGRMFPITDSSSTIIDCLLDQARALGVIITPNVKIERISKGAAEFELHIKDGSITRGQKLILTTGSSREGYKWAEELGHTIQEPIPSLFAFNIPSFLLQHLSGIAVEKAGVQLVQSKMTNSGPLLITHAGFSGPAILKLSAFAARTLHSCDYLADIAINWLPDQPEEMTYQTLLAAKRDSPQKTVGGSRLFSLPKNLWKTLVQEAEEMMWSSLSDKKLRTLAHKLHHNIYQMNGKTTNKEEFVTCGGITLSEIDFKTMQSKKCRGLFFAGEIVDIDGVTGGFNFQNAWTTAHIAGTSLHLNKD